MKIDRIPRSYQANIPFPKIAKYANLIINHTPKKIPRNTATGFGYFAIKRSMIII